MTPDPLLDDLVLSCLALGLECQPLFLGVTAEPFFLACRRFRRVALQPLALLLGGASLCLLRCARARALLAGRHYFTHEDVQAVALGVLGHRLIIRPEAEVEGKTPAEVIREVLQTVPVLETA